VFSLKNFSDLKYGVYLSVTSVILGVAREFLLIALLGLSAVNDQLQTYASITYVISMLGEAIRLATFNLLGKINFHGIIKTAFAVSLFVSLILMLFFIYGAEQVEPFFMLLAFITGFLNLFVSLYIAFYQYNNRFLGAQLVSVLPNFILIPGIVCVYFSGFEIVRSMLYLFAIVPFSQLLILIVFRPKTENTILDQGNFLNNASIILSQGIQCFGNQIFQITLRIALLRLGEGYLSLMTLLMKIFDSLRFILVDTYIGYSVSKWREHGIKSNNKPLTTLSTLWRVSLIVIFAISIVISLQNSNNLLFFAIQASVIMIIGFIGTSFYKITYYKLNLQKMTIRLIIILGLLDLLIAFSLYVVTAYVLIGMVFIIWCWYVLKPTSQALYLYSLAKKECVK
jgi:hypothetical protein